MYYLEVLVDYRRVDTGEFETDTKAQQRAEEIVTRGIWDKNILYLPHMIKKIIIKEKA